MLNTIIQTDARKAAVMCSASRVVATPGWKSCRSKAPLLPKASHPSGWIFNARRILRPFAVAAALTMAVPLPQ